MRNLGDFLLTVFFPWLIGVAQLKVINNDECNAMPLAEAAGAGFQFERREAGGIIDVKRGFCHRLGRVAHSFEVRFGHDAIAQETKVRAGAGAEQSHHKRFGGHFQTENGRGEAAVQGDVFGDVHCESCFANAWACSDDDHFAAVESAGEPVEICEPG